MRKTMKFMCKTTPLRQLTPFKYDKIAVFYPIKNSDTEKIRK